MQQTATLETWDGTNVEVEHVQDLAGGGARFDIEAEAGPRWRLDVSKTGTYEVVTSWDARGQLADVETPEWMDDIIARLQRA
ncbi:hypothetical protein [Halobellus ruber]|uniref:Uncharacterized protein n=1 Tax=Halobellus ruber TaxID=2761102 RepID=A0A7J9SDP8_9EURY|nr:hypothetical protein [Halobellus ruber]MBB6645044.1 hypothetical protein [Halobellus ruber]